MIKYRKEIDGLRALAVMSVILYHAGFKLFSGGYVGVDVFFVISGYLITSIIISEKRSGDFSLVCFYERRFRRIFPALFFVVAVSIPFAWILLPPSEVISFLKSISAVSLFISNVFFWLDGGYFATASEMKPLLHTWSLAVEEQYYLLFPLYIVLLWRLGVRRIFGILLFFLIMSLSLAQWGIFYKPVPTFFLLPTRGWEIAVGAFCFFLIDEQKVLNVSRVSGQLLSILGFILILFSVFIYSDDTPFPGIYALIPTLGAALVVLYANQENIVGIILCSPLMVGIGSISYSFYLWHQPVMVFGKYYFIKMNDEIAGLLIVLSIIGAWFSWRYIERPFRDMRKFSRAFVFAFFGGLSVLFFIFGYAAANSLNSLNGFVELRTARLLVGHKTVYASNMDERLFVKNRILCEEKKPEVIVVGSSRVMQIGEHNYKANLLNLAVSGASLEDDIAIIGMVAKKYNPKVIVIGADPWLFNANSGQERWQSIADEYYDALKVIGNPLDSDLSTRYAKPPRLSDAGCLVEMIRDVYQMNNRFRYVADNDLPERMAKIRSDGSRVYDIAYANQGSNQIEQGFDGLLQYSMSNYKYSPELMRIFERFIDHYKDQSRICLVLSPYHPGLYRRMLVERRVYIEVEQLFRDLARRKKISIVGSYDPAAFSCGKEEFYDGMHPKDSAMRKVMCGLGGRYSADSIR